MSFVVQVDRERWRDHLNAVRAIVERASGADPVPVIKGNGYGLGQARLARQAAQLDLQTVAVGTVFEIADALEHTLGDVIVLEPFEPRDPAAAHAWWEAGQRWDAARLVRTVASASALRSLIDGPGTVRVILEAQTSMHRFGLAERELLALLADADVRRALAGGRVQVLGLSLHLPIAQPADEPRGAGTTGAKVQEVLRWSGLWRAEMPDASTVWVSHLDDVELTDVARNAADVRLRVGTRLWLGDRRSLTASGAVLAVHPVPTGTHVGYRQRTGPKDGTLVVVSGGTAHGIGLSAPTPASSVRQRVVTVGTGALDAAGRALSPFTWAGKQRWFAEPPHQHHSMIWLPRGCVIPAVGERLPADVRFTTSRFDAVLGLDGDSVTTPG